MLEKLRSRRLTIVGLTLLWLPSALAGWLILSGRWLADPSLSLWRIVASLIVGLHTLVLLAGGTVIGWQVLAQRWRQRQAGAEIGGATPYTLGQLLAMSPAEFEVWVQRLFESRGYFVENTPDVADHGVDLRMAAPDGESAIVQCKRYRGAVGEPVIRDLYGAMLHEERSRGFLVTTGRFTQAATLWARGKPIELIDGQRLVRLANATLSLDASHGSQD